MKTHSLLSFFSLSPFQGTYVDHPKTSWDIASTCIVSLAGAQQPTEKFNRPIFSRLSLYTRSEVVEFGSQGRKGTSKEDDILGIPTGISLLNSWPALVEIPRERLIPIQGEQERRTKDMHDENIKSNEDLDFFPKFTWTVDNV